MFSADLLFGPVTITLALGAIVVLLLFWSSVRRLSYWKKRGIPSANTVPLLGSLYEYYRRPMHDVETERYIKLGRLYGHYESTSPMLSVGDPALVKDILVKDFAYFHERRVFNLGDKIFDAMLSTVAGEDWKRIRSIVSPTFTTGKIKRMLNIFKECAKTLCDNLETAGKGGKCVETKRLFGAFTMDVIANSAFSTKIDSHNDPENRFVKMAQKAFDGSLNWRNILFFVAPRLVKLLGISPFDLEPTHFFVNVILQIVEERKKSGRSRNDFLQLLIDTAKEVSKEEKWDAQEKDDIASNYGENEIEQQILKTATSKRLTTEELVAQCLLFFLAGYHTTAGTLSFAAYSLALNPEVQDKLRKEVDEVLKENNGEMSYDALQRMKYLDNVISETMRLYPSLGRLERTAIADYELGDTGITLRKGMVVTIPSYAIHRDPEFYTDPEKFDPDRFTPEERSTRDPYTYLPFGAGPRNCVGMRFALMEMKTCLASVVANFNIKRCSETKMPMEFPPGQGLLQPNDAIFIMEHRKDSQLIK